MSRAGFSKPDFAGFDVIFTEIRVGKLRKNVIDTPLIDISSTEIRERLARGDDVSGMISPNVLAYILKNHLYQPKRPLIPPAS